MSALLDSALLETAIGLVMVYFVLSSFASALYEMVASWLKLRAKDLEKGIRALLNDPATANAVLNHALLWTGKPSYIPASAFASALLDVLRSGHQPSQELGGAIRALAVTDRSLPGRYPALDATMNELATLPDELAALRRRLETWFDDAMERVSGQYKRQAQLWLFWIGLLVSLVFGVDTIRIASHLYTTPTVRAAVVAQAESAVATPPAAGQPAKSADAWLKDVQALNLPLGYGDPVVTPALSGQYGEAVGKDFVNRLPGILLTALALAQGSTFWFDLLKKLVNIRSAGRAPERSDKGTT